MAIIFELWAECRDDPGLEKLREHFHGLEYKLLTGREIRFQAYIEKLETPGLIVTSPQICGNGYGIETLQDTLEATEAGIFLYHRLKTAPDFRFAHVGWDAEKSTSADLIEAVSTTTDGRKNWSGFECVLNDELYQKLGSPEPFWKFRSGYWWQKYRGETYTPLRGSDQAGLFELCEKLLPGNLGYTGSFR